MEKHLQNVIIAYFNRLKEMNIWPVSPKPAPQQAKEEPPTPEGDELLTDREREGQAQTGKQKHEPFHSNKWLFVEHLDNRRGIKELKEEWLKIREEKDFAYPPKNPMKSMLQAISEERERRKTGRNQE